MADVAQEQRSRLMLAGGIGLVLMVLTFVGIVPFIGLVLAAGLLAVFVSSPGALESPGFLLSTALVALLLVAWALNLNPEIWAWMSVVVLIGGLGLAKEWRKSAGYLALCAMSLILAIGTSLDITPVLVFLALLLTVVVAAARTSGAYVYRRVFSLLPILLAVSFFSFALLSFLPGDLAVNIAGPGATPEFIAQTRAELNLDDPVLLRYLRWLADAITGDLGTSPFLREEIINGLARTVPISLQLMLYATVTAVFISVPLGIIAAYKSGSRFDRGASTTMFGLLALPNFVIALILILFFAKGKSILGLDWFPATVPQTSRIGFGENTFLHLKQILLPVLALCAGQTATYMRLLRTDMVATLQEDFIAVAKAKGMSTSRILLGHALRPSSFTLLTVLGINMAALIGGSLILEVIFVLPGVGSYLATAIFQRDYLVIQGVVVVLAVAFVLANLVVDLLYAILDPRIRDARALL